MRADVRALLSRLRGDGWRIDAPYGRSHVVAYAPDGSRLVAIPQLPRDRRWKQNLRSSVSVAGQTPAADATRRGRTRG